MDPLQQTFRRKSSRPGGKMECKFNIFKCVSKLEKTYFMSVKEKGVLSSKLIKSYMYKKWTEIHIHFVYWQLKKAVRAP